MAQNDIDTKGPSRLWDLPVALALLTRLPLPTLPDRAFANGARAVWAYPLVGLVLGAAGGAVMLAASAADLSAMIGAGLTLSVLVLLTGAMHEDGLADTADGLWGGHDRARRLDIMKDSRIGAYGVLALIVAMGLRWLGLSEISVAGLITALVVSRAMMVPLMHLLAHARDTGLSHGVGRPDAASTGVAVLIAIGCALLLGAGAGLAALLAAAAVATVLGALAQLKIGGQTGDILGATQITTEIAVLLTLTALT